MQNLRNKLIAGGAVLILAALGTVMNRQAAQAAGGPTVTIDPAQLPLPVTGSTTISGTVAATQSGAWNVGLASGASVHVNNTVTDPVRVRNVNDAIQAFQATGQCSSPAPNSCGVQILTVPVGKRAVIEYFSGNGELSPGQTVATFLATTVNGVLTNHFVPPTPPVPPIMSNITVATTWGQIVRVYADPGSPILATAEWTAGGSGSAALVFSISGYLVDVPFAP